MPPVSQQGSRAGLITGLVVSVVFALVFAVMFFSIRGELQKANNAVLDIEKRHEKVLPATPEQSPAFVQAKAIVDGTDAPAEDGKPAKAPLVKRDNVVEQIAGERDELIKLMTGRAGMSARDAADYVVATLAQLRRTADTSPVKLGGSVNFAGSDTTAVAKQLVDAYLKLAKQKVDADAATTAAAAKLAQYQKDQTEVMKGKDGEITKAQQQLAQKQASLDDINKQYAAALEAVKNANVGNLEGLNTQVADLNKQLTDLRAQIPPMQAKNAYLTNVLRGYRLDPTDNIVRRPDGMITNVSEDGKTCFIDLGQGDHLSTGMTFEVYDQRTGIPSLKADIASMDDETAMRNKSAGQKLAAATDKAAADKGAASVLASARLGAAGNEKYDQLPTGGKGSIEVVRIDPGHSAECRVIATNPGVRLREGDKVANLVYDKNVKFKIVVYGQFDLDYNGVPTQSDTAVIRRLVEQWGGTVVQANSPDELTPEVDFVVMGIAPQIPTGAADNPVDQDLIVKAKAQRDAYNNVLTRAREYSIPVLNQTRFLYYSGYFDQRNR